MGHRYGLWRLLPFLGKTKGVCLCLCSYGSPVSQALYTKPKQETALLDTPEACWRRELLTYPLRITLAGWLTGDIFQKEDRRVTILQALTRLGTYPDFELLLSQGWGRVA